MGIILIIIGIVIQFGLANSKSDSDGFYENGSVFMTNPTVRGILTLLSWILIIIGIITLFS